MELQWSSPSFYPTICFHQKACTRWNGPAPEVSVGMKAGVLDQYRRRILMPINLMHIPLMLPSHNKQQYTNKHTPHWWCRTHIDRRIARQLNKRGQLVVVDTPHDHDVDLVDGAARQRTLSRECQMHKKMYKNFFIQLWTSMRHIQHTVPPPLHTHIRIHNGMLNKKVTTMMGKPNGQQSTR